MVFIFTAFIFIAMLTNLLFMLLMKAFLFLCVNGNIVQFGE